MRTLGKLRNRFERQCYLFWDLSGVDFDMPLRERERGRAFISKANTWAVFLGDALCAPGRKGKGPRGLGGYAEDLLYNPAEGLPAWSWPGTKIRSALEETS